MTEPLVLIIRDGWGIGNPEDPGNAIAKADTPNIDSYLQNYPHTVLGTSGEDVGLVAGAQGSSEVGHLNMGAGRIVEQEVVRVNKLIESGEFFKAPLLVEAMENCRANNSALHIVGLVQDQGVHAMDTHLFALLEMAARFDLKKVFIHAFTDGRDTAPRSAMHYLQKLSDKMGEIGVGKIASVTGRYWAMDRDTNWDRIEIAYRALVFGLGRRAATWTEAVEAAYARADAKLAEAKANGDIHAGIVESDEFISPTLIADKGAAPHSIQSKDSVIFFNYRQDRAIQITKSLVEDRFDFFDRPQKPDICFVGLTRYYDEFDRNVLPPMNMSNILGEVLSREGLQQLRISETQKFAHVTSFFNSKMQEPFPGEERILIDSPKVPENEKPEMSAPTIADFCVLALSEGIAPVREAANQTDNVHLKAQSGLEEDPDRLAETYDVIIMNFVNGDMVGHTGDFEAVVLGIEAVDRAVGRVVKAALAKEGVVLITADHGNAEQMINPATGDTQTAHTTNPVELILVSQKLKGTKLRRRGRLADIAPTMLDLLGIAQPEEMTGQDLILDD